MSEFTLKINQSLVERTLDRIDFNPYKFIWDQSSNLREEAIIADDVNQVLLDFDQKLDDLGESALKTLDEDAKNEGLFTKSLEEFNEGGFQELLKKDSLLLSEDEKLKIKHYTKLEELQASIIFGNELAAEYVLNNGAVFSVDETIAQEAKIILGQAQAINRLDRETLILGSSFFKKVGGVLRNAAKTIGKWFKTQIAKVIQIGKPELKRLEINIWNRPRIILGNPVLINNLNVSVYNLSVHIPYSWRVPIPGQDWHHNVLKLNIRLGEVLVSTDSQYDLFPENNKIFVAPRFNTFKFSFKIFEIPFTISLSGLVNKILDNKRIEIYDVSNLALPLKLLDMKYEIEDVKAVTLANGLALEVGIRVSDTFMLRTTTKQISHKVTKGINKRNKVTVKTSGNGRR
ncbi:hypothetical protein JAO76_15645 [Pontibacter sp. BT310]|uniref:Uncharacterized protein n=1 Tax=Pontibacter populi TaxID=890055 RepID=A0ABS6XET1_9BACT|nr:MULTISPECIES: hypothetical protein [Pontibacter]MBJ6119643.1 hypothetical protein [Pontibacter sp. BT310]MBR0572070.1 hypothetical protein [Microvirga sp. STS03]MBW3366496.1 hypothetical protein [Pontibacter populi]